MDKQLPGSLGHVQVVLEELVDGEQRLLIQSVDGVLFENLLQEHLAQGSGQLIDQAADTQVLIVDDIALGVEHLAHLNGDLGLLIRLGQIPQMQCQGADAHEHHALAVYPQGLLNGSGHLFQVLAAGVLGHLVDQGHVVIAHAEDKVVLPVREHILHHVHGNGLGPIVHRADDKDAAGHLCRHMQLLGTHVDVTDEDVIRDDVLDKGALVVLFLVVDLGGVQRHAGHGAYGASHAVVSAGENRIIKVGSPAGHGLEGLALHGHAVAFRRRDGLHIFGPLFTDTGELAARDHRALGVDDADGAVCGLLELQHNVLKNSSRHSCSSRR